MVLTSARLALSRSIKRVISRAALVYLRHSPLERGKLRLLHFVWNRLWVGSDIGEVRLQQANVRMVCDLRRYIQRIIYFTGGYEKRECAMWVGRARGAEVIFDVGANVGLYTLLAAATNPDAAVHAFEPTPELVDALERNVALNGLRNVRVNAVAAGEESGSAFLTVMTGAGGNEGMNFLTDRPGQDTLPTAVISLDDYCRRNGITHVDLLKIDVEGAEHAVLVGSVELLRRQAIGYIMLELLDWAAERGGSSVDAIVDLLEAHGYALCRPDSRGLKPLVRDGLGRGMNVVAVPGSLGNST